MINRVGIVGGGAWGTALALVAARAGRRAIVYARDPVTVDALNQNAASPAHLGVEANVAGVHDVTAAAAADMVILAVPAQDLRVAATELAPFVEANVPVVIAAKGIEQATGKRLSEVVAEAMPAVEIAVLSGPSFASDVAKGLPTAVTIAAARSETALELCRALGGPSFRPYAETDVVGVELGGALKNVLAIAAGIVAGRGLGSSAGAAIVARGFAEMRRFAESFGARPETLMGLSGLGDVVLTCSTPQSRNFSVGLALGAGRPIPNLLAEGVPTAEIAARLAESHRISMPITACVAAVLSGQLTVDAAVDLLMSRPLRQESD
ncbi:MAG: NAD(P)H-dependent glycerol-3-phosphate dehydrogenase [Bauldia sp.]